MIIIFTCKINKKIYVNGNKIVLSYIKSKFEMQLNTMSVQKLKIIQAVSSLWLDK